MPPTRPSWWVHITSSVRSAFDLALYDLAAGGLATVGAMLASFLVSYSVFWVGKKFITLPRMGQVVFGQARKMKKITLAIILGVVIVFQVVIVLISVVGWLNQIWMMKVDIFLQLGGTERLMVAAIGALFLGPSMILIAYFNDFPRGYYIAILMTLAVFFMILESLLPSLSIILRASSR